MSLTDFHAKFFATHAADSLEKLAPALADAQMDLNPHQIDAALFAFKNAVQISHTKGKSSFKTV